MSKMTGDDYPEGYWERGEGSNYVKYGNDPGWGPTVSVMSEFHLPGQRLVEVGSAKGWFLEMARRGGFQPYGIDISPWAVSHAPETVQPVLSLGNAVSLPWEDGFSKIVCSWEFLEHVYEDEIDQVLGEMLRVSAPDAWWWHRIGISDPGVEFESNQQHDVTHYNEKPRTYWHKKFRELGLVRQDRAEGRLRHVFANRDWRDRFFVYARG